MEDLENEKQDRDEEKNRYLTEKHPPLQFSGLSLEELQVIHSVRQTDRVSWRQNIIQYFLNQLYLLMFYIHLQNLCKQLYTKIDVVDEERYGYEDKVIKHNKDVSLNQK